MPDPLPTIGSRLRELREARGLTVYALAALSGVGRSYLGEVESGKKVPGWDVVVKLPVALEADLGDFRGVVSRRA